MRVLALLCLLAWQPAAAQLNVRHRKLQTITQDPVPNQYIVELYPEYSAATVAPQVVSLATKAALVKGGSAAMLPQISATYQYAINGFTTTNLSDPALLALLSDIRVKTVWSVSCDGVTFMSGSARLLTPLMPLMLTAKFVSSHVARLLLCVCASILIAAANRTPRSTPLPLSRALPAGAWTASTTSKAPTIVTTTSTRVLASMCTFSILPLWISPSLVVDSPPVHPFRKSHARLFEPQSCMDRMLPVSQ
jgi:hypothetical protein